MDRFIDWGQTFRYERKYVVSGLSTADLERCIKTNPGLFTEIYQQRSINNIYLDSADLQHYFDNVNGAPARGKVRIRWYGKLFGEVTRPVLELKLKSQDGNWLIFRNRISRQRNALDIRLNRK